MGLRPETAFGCAYDFLLYPQPKVGHTGALRQTLLRYAFCATSNLGIELAYAPVQQDGERPCLQPSRVSTAHGTAVWVFRDVQSAQPSALILMQLFEEHQHEYQQLRRPGPLKIGIQIRTGDIKMGDGTLMLKDYKHFFDCAAQLEVRECRSTVPFLPVLQHAQDVSIHVQMPLCNIHGAIFKT